VDQYVGTYSSMWPIEHFVNHTVSCGFKRVFVVSSGCMCTFLYMLANMVPRRLVELLVRHTVLSGCKAFTAGHRIPIGPYICM